MWLVKAGALARRDKNAESRYSRRHVCYRNLERKEHNLKKLSRHVIREAFVNIKRSIKIDQCLRMMKEKYRASVKLSSKYQMRDIVMNERKPNQPPHGR